MKLIPTILGLGWIEFELCFQPKTHFSTERENCFVKKLRFFHVRQMCNKFFDVGEPSIVAIKSTVNKKKFPFVHKKQKNIVKPYRASDMCIHCDSMTEIMKQLSEYSRKVVETAIEKPEDLLQANCFSFDDMKKIKSLLKRRDDVIKHQENADRQRANFKASVELVVGNKDGDKVIFVLDFKQNMGTNQIVFTHASDSRF